jgi:hypothetical protein
VYGVGANGAGAIELTLADVPLPDLELVAGELRATNTTVESRCVLVESAGGNALRGRPMEPITPLKGALRFDPSGGGVRGRWNRLAGGAHNEQVAEAARFGMVNTLFHLERAASYSNDLLRELGAEDLPPVHAVVSAHAGSNLPGYCQGDGDYRKRRMYPFQGGHYRLSTLTTGIPEPIPVRPSGEIHLGPGIRRAPFAGATHYLRNAAHNPATIYHEYGHHLCRHTADFRLNAERAPERQRNGKTGLEEGICDYLTAALLGTGRPYGWYRPSRGAWRDPAAVRPLTAVEEDPHAVGAVWASAFWGVREALLERALLAGPRDYDRILLRMLLDLGAVAARSRDRRRRSERAAERSAPATILTVYLEALRDAAGVNAAALAEESLGERGLTETRPRSAGAGTC